MKAKFMEVWRGIEAEGPRDWWENEPEKKKRENRKPKKGGAKVGAGRDESGDWPLVRGGTVTKSDAGYTLSGGGEAFALQPLDPPLTGDGRAVFTVSYQSAAANVTRNAMFCFGAKPENDDLIKAGTAIGMGQHVVFEGGWGNVGTGAEGRGEFEVDDRMHAKVTVDLGKRECVLEVGGVKVVQKLPESVDAVRHFGIYTKATASVFSEIGVER